MDDPLHRLVRMKRLLMVMAVAYLAPMVLGAILVTADVPGFRELQARALAGVLRAGPIPIIARLLGEGRLLPAIAITFAWNLVVAACMGSIATGMLLPLPPLIAGLRGFLIGLIFADQLWLTFAHGLIIGGTLVLEIGAYVIAGALGLRLGIALLPRRGKAPPVRVRMAEFLADLRGVLPVVTLLLLLGAVWENVGLFFLGRLH